MNYTYKVGAFYIKYTTVKLIFRIKGMNITNIRVRDISSRGEGVNRKSISGGTRNNVFFDLMGS